MLKAQPISPPEPRAAAVAFLRDRIKADLAARDPYDDSILMVEAHAGPGLEVARRHLELVGVIVLERDGGGLRTRLCAHVEADVWVELAARRRTPIPRWFGEPLASRAAR